MVYGFALVNYYHLLKTPLELHIIRLNSGNTGISYFHETLKLWNMFSINFRSL